MNEKPIDKLRAFLTDREAKGHCMWLSAHRRYSCYHTAKEGLDFISAAGNPCTLEDWATCPLNKEGR